MIGQRYRRQHQACPVVIHPQAEHQRGLLGMVHPQQAGDQPTRGERGDAQSDDDPQCQDEEIGIGLGQNLREGERRVGVIEQQ